MVDPQRHVASLRPSTRLTLLGLLAGLALGAAAFAWPGAGWDTMIGVLEPAGAMWLAAIRMTVLPLMVAIVLVTMGRAGTAESGRYALSAALWFSVILVATMTIIFVAGALVLDAFPLDPAARAAFQTAAGGTAPDVAPAPVSLRDRLVQLVPTNLFAAVVSGDLFAVLIATLLFGAALRYVPGESRDRIVDGAQALADWCLALASLLLRVLPVAAFVMMFVSTARSGGGMAAGLAYWVVLVSVPLVAVVVAFIPLTAWLGGRSMAQFARAVWPVQLFALSSRSSTASLPAMVDAARGGLRIPDRVADVTLPLAISSFKIHMAISPPLTLLFLLHVYELPVPLVPLLLSAAMMCLKSFASPGMPSASYWSMTPVYVAMGVPIEGVLLTMAVDAIPDIFKTVANVTAPLSVTAIVAHRAGEPTLSAASVPGSTPAAAPTA